HPASEEKIGQSLDMLIRKVLDGLNEGATIEALRTSIRAIILLLSKLPETAKLSGIRNNLMKYGQISEDIVGEELIGGFLAALRTFPEEIEEEKTGEEKITEEKKKNVDIDADRLEGVLRDLRPILKEAKIDLDQFLQEVDDRILTGEGRGGGGEDIGGLDEKAVEQPIMSREEKVTKVKKKDVDFDDDEQEDAELEREDDAWEVSLEEDEEWERKEEQEGEVEELEPAPEEIEEEKTEEGWIPKAKKGEKKREVTIPLEDTPLAGSAPSTEPLDETISAPVSSTTPEQPSEPKPAAPTPKPQKQEPEKPKPSKQPARPKPGSFFGRLRRQRRPKTIQRYGDISCPLKMKIQKVHNVEVCVRAAKERVKGVASIGIQVAVPKSPQEVPKIEVLVMAPGFDIKGDVRRSLEIPVEDRDSKTLVFKVIPQSLGEKYVFVEFYQYGKLLGRSVITVQVEKKVVGTPPLESKAFSLKTFTPQEVDLDATLRIVKFENKFFFSLFTRHSAAVVDPSSMFGTRALEADQIEALKELMHHSAFKRDADAAEETLKNLGQIVYKLIPPKMRQNIERTNPNFLLIETGDMFVPWELAYDGKDFWATKYSLGKRIFDETSDFKAPPLCFGTTTVKSAVVSSSAEDLKFATKEVEMFEKFAQTKRISLEKIIADRKKAVDALRKGVNLWHYVGHGEFDEIHPMKSALLLKPPLSAEEISRISIQGFPLIFANACEAGTLQKESYGVAGIARSFLGSGAIAFLGPLWEIPDKIAAEFAVGFYQRLLYEGKHIGVAIRETKLDLKNKFPGVLWATFSLFGDPTLQICSPLSSS
ncbi:MAG: CHAT domain-containing protein, partial [Candidatus Hodarchaeota archaeon]